MAGTGCPHLLALYWLMVFIHETPVMPSSGKVKTKRHLFSCLVISRSECCPMCQLLQQEQITTLRHLDGTGCTLFLALYWLMVFVHNTNVMPSSSCKVKTKMHLFSYLVLAGSECCLMCCCSKQEHITTLRTFGWYRLHQYSALYWLMAFIHETHLMPSSAKVKTKGHLSLYLVLVCSECWAI